MLDTSSSHFIVAISFTVSAILLVIIAYAVHIWLSNKRLNQAQKRLKAMTVNLSAAEERERKRIAEELHDRIGETLVLSNRSIENLKKKWASDEANQDLDELSQTIQKLMKGTRSLIFELIPPALYDLGLEAALESFAENCKKQYGIDVTVVDDGQEKWVESDVAVFLYKAVRELILNVVKHSGADAATIRLSRVQDKYRVVVEDNGIGFNRVHPDDHEAQLNGYGLFNIQIQAEHYGGYLKVATFFNQSGCVTIEVPLKRTETHGGD